MGGFFFRRYLDTERALELHRQGLTDEEIATKLCVHPHTVGEWRRKRSLLPNKKIEDDGYAADIKKCVKCIYWRSASGSETQLKFCHHLLDTERCRVRGEGKECLSFTRKATRGREDA